MSTLVELAQKHIEETMRDLSDDDDFLPFMAIRDHKDDVIYIAIPMPDGNKERNQIADVMTALCMAHRAVEVMFASVVWAAVYDPAEDDPQRPRVMPSQHPDRFEQVFLLEMDTKGKCATHTANVIRENGMIGVGLWSSTEFDKTVSGRFGDAIYGGMELGQKLTPDLCAYIDNEIENGDLQEFIMRLAKTIDATRWEILTKEVSRN